VESFARTFMALRHRDKLHQLELLHRSLDVEWVGIRPLQMRKGPRRAEYRLGFHPYSGFSVIHFADCAHAMIRMLTDDTWLHKAPIVQY
jgi:putative NADH-flavin reductase